ncbi:MAG: threonylcarbamoyl-AMP synthase [Tannerellaceae bacterium]|nr:threonylcarbamoyl-AMP synthase [Tannerellaceae bacterium]
MTEDIANACRTLQGGGLILYPTDTIWGIGCDATNNEAVRRVYALKRRTAHKSMLVLMDSPDKLGIYVESVPDIAYDLIEAADKPLTLIFSGAQNLSPELVDEDGSIGVRITREAFSQALCHRFGRPIVSTSANISGEVFPSTFDDIPESIRKGVDYIVRYRQEDTTEAQPSGIIKLGEGGLFRIIR